MSARKYRSWIFVCGILLLGSMNYITYSGGQQDTDIPITSSIKHLQWECDLEYWTCLVNDTKTVVTGYNSAIHFRFDAIFKNSRETAINTTIQVAWEFSAEFQPCSISGGFILEYIHPESPGISNISQVISPGKTTKRCWIRIVFFDFCEGSREELESTIPASPPVGTYKFQISDTNTLVTSSEKSLHFTQSAIINFFWNKPWYIPIVIGIGVTLFIFTWLTVQKIQNIRLPGQIKKKLDELTLLMYEAQFPEVNQELEKLLLKVEYVDDKTITSAWHDMKMKCSINIDMKNRVENSMLTKENLLEILKEIHLNEMYDPSIESLVVNKLKTDNWPMSN